MRSRIFLKLMLVFLVVIGVTTITLQITIRKMWEQTLRAEIERNLQQKTLMFAERVETDRQHALMDIVSQEAQAAGARATDLSWICSCEPGRSVAVPARGSLSAGANRPEKPASPPPSHERS